MTRSIPWETHPCEDVIWIYFLFLRISNTSDYSSNVDPSNPNPTSYVSPNSLAVELESSNRLQNQRVFTVIFLSFFLIHSFHLRLQSREKPGYTVGD